MWQAWERQPPGADSGRPAEPLLVLADVHAARGQRLLDELDELLRLDWDEALARANFRWAPTPAEAAAHVVTRSPNQFVDADGSVRDAEPFDSGVTWGPFAAGQRTE